MVCGFVARPAVQKGVSAVLGLFSSSLALAQQSFFLDIYNKKKKKGRRRSLSISSKTVDHLSRVGAAKRKSI
jgi:hypothetical protein